MALYEVAVVELPTRTEREDGRLEKLVLGPLLKIARNDQSAAMMATMDHTELLKKHDESRLEVHVRPF